ncbi:ABC transporter ATP-binding protein [Streptosporangium sp. NBC_01755]|uniref:ABC transporter ATP-binding protein n=1 Tax=unclassified Streptosporangium TaxID=2632669 RepID=UPI002DDAE603|nr:MULTISPECIES: ABC transporter ATP-binding protein [unclassified Streptosporangium]WSA28883.1 ABC transporter ATP-binding protein [Streptosporangium sp. NBC_01810]WSC99671.1 ABC transporter ATP-binding protein [Streptosporangium sp. NBC_01755]
MTNDAVSLKNVTKRFGAVRAVDDLSLDIPAGQTVALLGPNGAGKSTGIGLLLGLLAPDSGTVRVFGGAPEAAIRGGRLAAMPQEGGLVSRTTVGELLGFVSGTYRAPLPLREVLAVAGLEELAGRRVERLSGGQAQRLRFALALAGDPELILLDEPTAALDVRARREFWESMRAFAARGRTVLFSTHYLEEADEYADRVVVIDRGRIVADGTSREIKRLVSLTTVSVTAPAEDVALLERLPGVTSVEIRGNRAHLRTRDADATVLALAEAGAVRDLEVAPAALEDAFIALTGVDA